MNKIKAKTFPLGDSALTVEFGDEISLELNKVVLRLAEYFSTNAFVGLQEIVPAYSSLTIFYDVGAVRKNFSAFPTAFAAVKSLVETALDNSEDLPEKNSRLVKIPVCFDKKFAPDLEFVAASNRLTPAETIEIFLGQSYRVFMLGFLPGFAYMGEIDARISATRKTSPRREVAKGSVGIANRQTGIYSLRSPGGWQIIGRTNVELFTPEAESPTFLQAGDSVEFYESEF